MPPAQDSSISWVNAWKEEICMNEDRDLLPLAPEMTSAERDYFERMVDNIDMDEAATLRARRQQN